MQDPPPRTFQQGRANRAFLNDVCVNIQEQIQNRHFLSKEKRRAAPAAGGFSYHRICCHQREWLAILLIAKHLLTWYRWRANDQILGCAVVCCVRLRPVKGEGPQSQLIIEASLGNCEQWLRCLVQVFRNTDWSRTTFQLLLYKFNQCPLSAFGLKPYITILFALWVWWTATDTSLGPQLEYQHYEPVAQSRYSVKRTVRILCFTITLIFRN